MIRGIAFATLMLAAPVALGQAPWGDEPVRVVHEGQGAEQRVFLTASAVGHPVGRVQAWDARRRLARRNARARAVAAIHVYLDDQLARAGLGPREMSALHDAIDTSAEVVETRPLVDAGAVVRVRVPASALHGAAAAPGAPWGAHQ